MMPGKLPLGQRIGYEHGTTLVVQIVFFGSLGIVLGVIREVKELKR